jgi:hypothetical protein
MLNLTHMPERELERVHTVNRYLNFNISKEKELQQIVELAAKLCGSPIAMITFMDDKTQYIKFSVGTDVREVPFENTICQYTIVQKDLLVIANTLEDERVMNNPFVRGGPGLRFYAGSPLITDDDQSMGTLCVYDLQPKTLNPVQEKMLGRLARQVTRLLEFDASLNLLKDQYNISLAEETKLRSFFESSASCHLLLDRQLRVVSFNKALADIMEMKYQLRVEEGMQFAEHVHHSFVKEFTLSCQKALQGESIRIESIADSLEDDMFWYITFEPALDFEGNIIGVSYSATDITQTVLHEKTVTRQAESFQEIERILSRELEQPLNAARNAMAGLKQEGYPDHLTEFHLLDQTFKELADKTNVVLSRS